MSFHHLPFRGLCGLPEGLRGTRRALGGTPTAFRGVPRALRGPPWGRRGSKVGVSQRSVERHPAHSKRWISRGPPPLLPLGSSRALFSSAAREACLLGTDGGPYVAGAPSCCCLGVPRAPVSSKPLGGSLPQICCGGPLQPQKPPQGFPHGEGLHGLPTVSAAERPRPLGAPTLEIGALVAAAEIAAAKGCGCCPLYWQQTAAAAAALTFTWQAGGHTGSLGAPPPQIALPLLRPLLRANARLSAAIGAAADTLKGPQGPPSIFVGSSVYKATASGGSTSPAWSADGGPLEAPGGYGDILGTHWGPPGALVEMVLLWRQTVCALLEVIRCALRGPNRHGGGAYGGLPGAPLSVRELAAVAGGFRGPRKALLLLCEVEAREEPPGGVLESPRVPSSVLTRGAPTNPSGASFKESRQDRDSAWGPLVGGAPRVASWGEELRGLYKEVIAGVLLQALGDTQRPRLPPKALTGSLWGALDRVCWVGSGGAPTGLAGAQGILLKSRISLSGLLQVLAAFGPPPGAHRKPQGRALEVAPLGNGGPQSDDQILHLGPPVLLLQLLERQIWEAQGDWGAPGGASIRQPKGAPFSAAALQQQQQRQQQQQDIAEGAEVERLVFAAAVLAEARAAGGPPKGSQGPFFLALSLIGNALQQRLDVLLSSTPETLQGPVAKGPFWGAQGTPVRDPLSGGPPPLFGEEIRELLPPGVLGPPGAPSPAVVALLPLLLLRAFALAAVSHAGLLSGICYSLVRPLGVPPLEGPPGAPQQLGTPQRVLSQDSPKQVRLVGPLMGKVQGGAPLGAPPQVSCLLDLWPSAAVCQLAWALHLLGAPSPPFFRFLFSHYGPPEQTQGKFWGAGGSQNFSQKGFSPRAPFRQSHESLAKETTGKRRSSSSSSSSNSNSSSRSAAAFAAVTAAAAAAAARRALADLAAADGALSAADIEDQGAPSGGLMEAWAASVGWLLKAPQRQRRFVRMLLQEEGALLGPPLPRGGSHGASRRYERDFSRCSRRELLQLLLAAATSGAPPPPPKWLEHITRLLGAPDRGSFAAPAAAAAAATTIAEDLEALGLALPYLPSLSALPAVGGPSKGSLQQGMGGPWEPPSGAPLFPLTSGLGKEQVRRLPVTALPSLLLGLLLHAPPPGVHRPRISSSSRSSSKTSSGVIPWVLSHWSALGPLSAVLEGTARGLVSVWETQFAPSDLKVGAFASLFGISFSGSGDSQKGPLEGPLEGLPGASWQGVTGATAARLCRQTLTACLAMGHLVRPLLSLSPSAAAAAALTPGQQQQLELRVKGRRRGLLLHQKSAATVCLHISCPLRLLPLQSLRHLLLLLLLSSSPSLWGAPGAPHAQPAEGLLLLLQQQQQEDAVALANSNTKVEAAAAAPMQLLPQPVLSILEVLLEGRPEQQQQQQQQLGGEGPRASQFQREVAAVLQDLSGSLGAPMGAPVGGPLESPRGFTLRREVPVGPYFIDLLLGAP